MNPLREFPSLPAKILLSLVVPLVLLVVVEGLFFAGNTVWDWLGPEPAISRFEWCGDCPEIYRNNPGHPAVDARGFRYCGEPGVSGGSSIRGLKKILILGDSVTFGFGVACEETFPWLLEAILNHSGLPENEPVEVINSGVSGYSTYNELQLYRGRGRQSDPDLVVLALVLNDVANPRLHWSDGGRRVVDVPPEAIPNQAYDVEHAQPVMALWQREISMNRFLVGRAVNRLRRGGKVPVEPGRVPIRLTGEDDLAITVLTDSGSAESQWLSFMLSRLQAEIQLDGKELAVMVVPLSYQLDADYPHDPQRNIVEMCLGQDIPVLDLLPAFKDHRGPSLYLGNQAEYEDVWHLSPEGHKVTAGVLHGFLLDEGLWPARDTGIAH
jgi:lysophospholipase L1-like esterase